MSSKTHNQGHKGQSYLISPQLGAIYGIRGPKTMYRFGSEL